MLVAVLLFWLTATPAAQQLSERQLGIHHVLHWLQFAAGLVIAANWRRRSLRRHPGLAAAVVTAALTYVLAVHLPGPLDRAAAIPPLHVALHGGLFVAGAVLGASWRDVTELARILIVIGTMSVMTILSLAEISGSFTYSAYPAGQEAPSGVVMLAGMGLFWIALAFASVPARLSRRRHPVLSAAIALPLGILIIAAYRAG